MDTFTYPTTVRSATGVLVGTSDNFWSQYATKRLSYNGGLLGYLNDGDNFAWLASVAREAESVVIWIDSEDTITFDFAALIGELTSGRRAYYIGISPKHPEVENLLAWVASVDPIAPVYDSIDATIDAFAAERTPRFDTPYGKERTNVS